MLIGLFCCQIGLSQYTEAIRTSRPGQAFVPYSVGHGVFQIQTGLNLNGQRYDIFEDKLNGQDYSMLIRYGIFERAEFRTHLGLSRSNSQPLDQTNTGFSTLGFGTKINFVNGEGNKPSLGFQADFFLPAVSDDFKSDNVATTLMLAHTQNLTEALGLSTNFGVTWDGNGSSAGLYTINLGFPLFGAVGGFVETYGFYDSNFFDVFFDGGLAWSVNNHVVLDTSAGYGKNDGVKNFFFDFGISWRVG